MADAVNNEFDRWVAGSPDVKANDQEAFTQALSESMSYVQGLQSDAAAFQQDGEGNVGSVNETVVD
jgi:hypothetical protein